MPVTWVNPTPSRFPVLSDYKRLLSNPSGPSAGSIQPEWLTVIKPNSLPIEPLRASGKINYFIWRNTLEQVISLVSEKDNIVVVGKPSEFAIASLKHQFAQSFVYDMMDDCSAFHKGFTSRAIQRRERWLIDHASIITASSTQLFNKYTEYNHKLKLIKNACGVDNLPKNPVHKNIKPVIGYVGTIAKWFDWQIVLAIAESVPEMTVRLIGPSYVSPPQKLPVNIELHPACNHEDAMHAMSKFDIGLIPFHLDEITKYVDPVKYYEYCCLGKPVLSTKFGEMIIHGNNDGTYLVDQDSDLRATIIAALKWEADPFTLSEFRESNTWEYRFNVLIDHPLFS